MIARKPLVVSVAGIGDFRFRHRTIRDQFKIEVEAFRLLDGETSPPPGLRHFAVMMATLAVLKDTTPPGFDLDTLDPLDPAAFESLEEVYAALRTAEDAFRGRVSGGGEGAGQGTGATDADMVSD